MTTNQPPSVAVMKLSKAQYIQLADQFRESAQQAHQDMRQWMNRARLAESQLAVLRTEYEPQHRNRPALTDAAGNQEAELPSTPAEQE